VLPLKALMLNDNFAQGCSEAKELSLEFGFKLIILYIRILFLYSATFNSPFQKGAGAMAMCLGVSPFLKGAFGRSYCIQKRFQSHFFIEHDINCSVGQLIFILPYFNSTEFPSPEVVPECPNNIKLLLLIYPYFIFCP
jgi:hypothetical protein